MTETTASPSESTEWMELQRKYWDAWSQLCQQTLNPNLLPANISNPWTQALDNWWQAVSPGLPEQSQGFLEKMIEQGKSFFQMSEECTRFLSSFDPGRSVADWQELWQSRVSELKTAFSQSTTEEMKKAMRSLFPFFELPLDTWTRTLSSASLLPGDYLQVLKPEGLADELHDRIGRFLSVPGVGYTREWQEQAQRSARLLLDYERALQDYAHVHGKLGIDTLELLSKKVIARAEKGEEIKSLREVYDLWVDCCEETYNEFVFTDEYAEVYGHLVNALMALKHHSQNMMDEAMGALNMPTHKGIITLQCRQQELRRELMELRARLSEQVSKADLKGLQAELKALRAGIENMAAVHQELKAVHAELNTLKTTSVEATAVSALAPEDGAKPTRRTPAPSKTKTPKPAKATGE